MHASAENMTMTIYVPRSMKRALELEAAREDRSVSGLIRLACSRYLADVTARGNEKTAPTAVSPHNEKGLTNEHGNGSSG
jgi:hypothetical protein